MCFHVFLTFYENFETNIVRPIYKETTANNGAIMAIWALDLNIGPQLISDLGQCEKFTILYFSLFGF